MKDIFYIGCAEEINCTWGHNFEMLIEDCRSREVLDMITYRTSTIQYTYCKKFRQGSVRYSHNSRSSANTRYERNDSRHDCYLCDDA